VATVKPKRGDVYWVVLDPTVASEIKKTRPAVIVSNDSCNSFGTRVVVVPITSNVTTLYPGEANVSIGKRAGRALGDQMRSIDKARLGKRIGRLDRQQLRDLDDALRITLDL
jgi:mRNA interferase MazF